MLIGHSRVVSDESYETPIKMVRTVPCCREMENNGSVSYVFDVFAGLNFFFFFSRMKNVSIF